MKDYKKVEFLAKRMKELREKNGITMEEMALKLAKNGIPYNKSKISRLEAGKMSEKNTIEEAINYCIAFNMDDRQINQFLRGDRVVIPDTSALLANPQLIDELNEEYNHVIIPKIVIDELDDLKNSRAGKLGTTAYEIIRGISYGERTISMDCNGDSNENNDCKIISVAKEASNMYNCKVEIITDDTDYSAYLKGNDSVSALHIREYMATKQELVNMIKLDKIDKYYADNYDDCEIPTKEEANAYLPEGYTLIISAVYKKNVSIEQRKEKIKWLISHGANVNKRDCKRRYFPPLTHAIQLKDFEMFMFLLNECHANPNVGSRNPYDAGKLRQKDLRREKNEGNMPLMVAAWEGKKDFVVELLKDERISINQQDANGFTALMKACMNGHIENNRKLKKWDIRNLLIKAGADQKIVDIDGKTADDWVSYYQLHGSLRDKSRRYSKNK